MRKQRLARASLEVARAVMCLAFDVIVAGLPRRRLRYWAAAVRLRLG